jgi:hypothetical protein
MVKKLRPFTLALALFSLLAHHNLAISNVPADADGMDDSEVIVALIKESIPAGGLISIEQHTGRLLFNPTVAKLHSMVLRQKFLLPAIVVNQTNGLHLISELPFSCFMLTAGELASDQYKGYRQHQTLQYIRDVKQHIVSRVLICEPIGKTAKNWRDTIALDNEDNFVFEAHASIAGEYFYYYINESGSFEMYM